MDGCGICNLWCLDSNVTKRTGLSWSICRDIATGFDSVCFLRFNIPATYLAWAAADDCYFAIAPCSSLGLSTPTGATTMRRDMLGMKKTHLCFLETRYLRKVKRLKDRLLTNLLINHLFSDLNQQCIWHSRETQHCGPVSSQRNSGAKNRRAIPC